MVNIITFKCRSYKLYYLNNKYKFGDCLTGRHLEKDCIIIQT